MKVNITFTCAGGNPISTTTTKRTTTTTKRTTTTTTSKIFLKVESKVVEILTKLNAKKELALRPERVIFKLCLCSPEIRWVENEGLFTCPTLGRGSTSSLEACQVFIDSNTSYLNTVARNLATKKRDAMSSSGKLRAVDSAGLWLVLSE